MVLRRDEILITGAAGFIGFHLARRLLTEGHFVTGVDNLNDYYDPGLKRARLKRLCSFPNFQFFRYDIANSSEIRSLFNHNDFTLAIHLAAQAGVRRSVTEPHAYVQSNVLGFLNILEGVKESKVRHLVFASSSSVYGENAESPWSETQRVDQPESFYAVTKRTNELMAYTYASMYRIPITGLRFFTVYGPWGRPDMAYFLFTRAIMEGEPIKVFNQGHMLRDFTYIDDVIEAISRVLAIPPGRCCKTAAGANVTRSPYFDIYNIGSSKPVALHEFIEEIERAIGKKAEKRFLPMQPGDVPVTFADVTRLAAEVGFKPTTAIRQGVARFCEWYQEYYKEAVVAEPLL